MTAKRTETQNDCCTLLHYSDAFRLWSGWICSPEKFAPRRTGCGFWKIGLGVLHSGWLLFFGVAVVRVALLLALGTVGLFSMRASLRSSDNSAA
jgi:hypothetical protein